MKSRARSLQLISCLVCVAFSARSVAAQTGTIGNFPHVAVPAGNPMTLEKTLLGKALFFEEQLSSDDTMACATCHLPEAGGADLRAGTREPGIDGQFFTDDDEFGSPGMVRQDPAGNYQNDALFGVARRATNRNAPTVFGAAFFRSVFWDMRAGEVFRDQAGNVVLPALAALESQAVNPPVSPIEMAHDTRSWPAIIGKLASVRPLDLARDLPPALGAFVAGATYGELFERAFGSPGITRERIAMALATFERTLVPDHTPFDLATMTTEETLGFQVFQSMGNCSTCHLVSNLLFSDGQFRSSSLHGHPRSVKTPTLRNVGLQRRLMSSGQFASLDAVVRHYEGIGFFPSLLTPLQRRAVLAFLGHGLTDERVPRREPPFDRPTLHSEVEPFESNQYGDAAPGSGDLLPRLLGHAPAHLGNAGFKIGIGNALGGAQVMLLIGPRRSAPGSTLMGVPLHVDPGAAAALQATLAGTGAGQGVATFALPIPAERVLLGLHRFAQVFVLDPGAPGGLATTRGAEFQVFSERLEVPATRPGSGAPLPGGVIHR